MVGGEFYSVLQPADLKGGGGYLCIYSDYKGYRDRDRRPASLCACA